MKDIAGSDITSWVKTDADANLLNELIGIESTYEPPPALSTHMWGWKPYPLGKFGGLLKAAIQAYHTLADEPAVPSLLEVGCGIGTKLVLASKVFGVRAQGFDVDGVLIDIARTWADHYDAPIEVWEDYAGSACGVEYEAYDIIFLNKPFRDVDDERELELGIYKQMGLGSVIILGNGVTVPQGWLPVAQDVMASVWIKICKCYKVEDFLQVDLMGQASGANTACTLCGRDFVIEAYSHA